MSRLLAGKSLFFNILKARHPSSIVANYHSRHGVYGCKPVKERAPYILSQTVLENRIKECSLYQLVTAYRQHGHRRAKLDPLHLRQQANIPELDANLYGLCTNSNEIHALTGLLSSREASASVQNIINQLETMYCGPLTAEFQHLSNLEEREWFALNFEVMHQELLTDDSKIKTAELMLKAQAFDHFLASKFTTVKRYGGEGAESAIGFYDELFRLAAKDNINDVVVCLPHRGRLNLLTTVMKYPPVIMFRKMKGMSEFPPDLQNSGDVVSHLFFLWGTDHAVLLQKCRSFFKIKAINPVAMGKTRARQQSLKQGEYAPQGVEGETGDGALCFMIHGDAAFAGQGIVAETFTMCATPHFNVGGSVHLIVNNQIGFTTDADRARSSHHCSDIGKMVECPVIHVNADHPEEVVKACRLAMAYRQQFRKDVLVDYVCYRKWGHNEMDEPAFTQPHMYDVIRNRQSIPDMYADELVSAGVCPRDVLTTAVSGWNKELLGCLAQVDSHVPKAIHLERQWSGLVQTPANITTWDTGVPPDVLKFVGAKSVSVPKDMVVHPTLAKTHVQRRIQMLDKGTDLDWATAEALAFGSLLYQGFNVRISGQDVGRGTFSHRHCMLVDQETESMYVPLNHMVDDSKQGHLEVCNSILSEEAGLGFEYGVSIENPNRLAIWEAQFGDFFNGAQIIIDTLITGGDAKWLLQSGLVMLLPHGIDGAGPDHSSCKMERFLQQTGSSETRIDGDDVNMQVVNPSTPAQYFHVLRRQMIRDFRKPLIVVAPKGMLRHPSCVSTLNDLAPGTTFAPVLGDPNIDPKSVKKVVFVSGKHYYTVKQERESRGLKDLAIIRLESLCPFPAGAIQDQLQRFPNASDFVWAQEEHRNQGAWSFVGPRFMNTVGKKLRYVGRDVSGTPATGIGEIHKKESKEIIEALFAK